MRLGNPQIIECPFCGTEKRIYSVLSRTIVNFGACYWSDNKRVDPIPFEVSFVQKCPKCGKYYILSRQKEKYAEDNRIFDSTSGTLIYRDMKKAMIQLCNEGFKDIDEECSVRVLFLHKYNDRFCRNERKSGPRESDIELHQKNILWLIDNWATDDLMKAELYREAGYMDRAIEILANTKVDDGFILEIKNEIERRAKAKDTSVFRLDELLETV